MTAATDCPCDRDKTVDPWCASAGECVRQDDAPEIITSFIYPPIPDRRFDWCAYYDPEGTTGWGSTEQEAIADLEMLTEATQ